MRIQNFMVKFSLSLCSFVLALSVYAPNAQAVHYEGPWATDFSNSYYYQEYNPFTGLLDDCVGHQSGANVQPSFPAYDIFPAGPTNIWAPSCFQTTAYYNNYINNTPIPSGYYRGMSLSCAVNFASSTELLAPSTPWPFPETEPSYPLVFRQSCFIGIENDPHHPGPDVCEYYTYSGGSGYDCSLYRPYISRVENDWLAAEGIDPSNPGGTPPGGSGTPPSTPGAGGSSCNDSASTVKDPDCLTKHQRDIIMDRITIGDQNSPGTVNIGTVYEGGEQLINFINEFWDVIWVPHMQNMIGQWSVMRTAETNATGMLLDADAVTRTESLLNNMETQQRLNMKPSGQVCAINTLTPIIGRSEFIVRAVSKGYRNDFIARALNADASPERDGPAADYALRWENYETHFCNFESNKGAPGCAADGTLPNADLQVEQFLLADTIDHSAPESRAAAYALLRNLVDPDVPRPLPMNVTDTAPGQDILLARRNKAALRHIPVSVIADIIARRTNIPTTDNPSLTGTHINPNPFQAEVEQIRLSAGVDPNDIAAEPSYNEMMLALTKEQFLTPEYYMQTASLPAQMSQEQARIDQLINLQLYDLYDLQEKINALMALRTAMKLNEQDDFKGSGR